jgi:hypothetical protein
VLECCRSATSKATTLAANDTTIKLTSKASATHQCIRNSACNSSSSTVAAVTIEAATPAKESQHFINVSLICAYACQQASHSLLCVALCVLLRVTWLHWCTRSTGTQKYLQQQLAKPWFFFFFQESLNQDRHYPPQVVSGRS